MDGLTESSSDLCQRSKHGPPVAAVIPRARRAQTPLGVSRSPANCPLPGPVEILVPAQCGDNGAMPNCANCGASMRMAEGRLTCDHCGTEQELPAALEYVELLEATDRRCPLCSTPLTESRVDAVPLLCCPGCFGMLIQMRWFAAGDRRRTASRNEVGSDPATSPPVSWRENTCNVRRSANP